MTRSILLCAALMATRAAAEVPAMIQFQGRIELPKAELEAQDDEHDKDKERSKSKPFEGTGRFRFSIVSSTGAVLWSNTPGSLASPPPTQVSLPVRNGLFNVALGDPVLGMPPLTAEVFAEPDRSLRIFFQGEHKDGQKVKLTSERELLPAQRLLTVPFAFQAARAQQAVDKATLQTLLAGATVQGSFAVAGRVRSESAAIGKGTIFIGPAFSGGAENTIAFSSFGVINTTGGKLDIDAADGVAINAKSTGAVSLAGGGGNVGVGTSSSLFKLHVASGAGETGDILVVSTGASNVFRVSGSGEVRANKFIGDGSGLTGISGGGAPSLSPMPNATTVVFNGPCGGNGVPLPLEISTAVITVPITFPASSPTGVFRVLVFWNLFFDGVTNSADVDVWVTDGSNEFGRAQKILSTPGGPYAINGSGVSPGTYAPGATVELALTLFYMNWGPLGIGPDISGSCDPAKQKGSYLTVQVVPF